MDADTVFLKDIPFMLEVGKDAWLRDGKAQPVYISLRVAVSSFDEAASCDDVSKSVDYGKLYKNIQANLDSQKSHINVRNLARDVLFSTNGLSDNSRIEITLPKAALRAEGGIRYTLELETGPRAVLRNETVQFRDIKCACTIGVNPHERRDKQVVVVGVTFRADMTQAFGSSGETVPSHPAFETAVNECHEIIKTVVERVEGSSFQTVEALADAICSDAFIARHLPEIEVSVEKPYAIPSIGVAGVCIQRRRSYYVK